MCGLAAKRKPRRRGICYERGAVDRTGGRPAAGEGDRSRPVCRRECWRGSVRGLGADLGGGTIDDQGHLVCPWHHAAYDIRTGSMVRGPQGVFAKIPGLDRFYRAFTKVLPLRRGKVVERDESFYVQ